MQATGPGGVAEVVHALRFTQHLRPRHFIQMVCKCHWVCYEFQAIVQAAVRLDVQIFRVRIGDIQQLFSVVTVGAAVIDFELHAEMPQALAMKHKIRCVIVLVHNVTMLIPAGCAVGVVVIIPIRAVAVNNPAAVITADVVFIKAVVAECVGIVLDGVFLVDHSGHRLRSGDLHSPRRASRLLLGTYLRLNALHRSLHKFLFRSLSVPPFRLVKLNILRQAA